MRERAWVVTRVWRMVSIRCWILKAQSSIRGGTEDEGQVDTNLFLAQRAQRIQPRIYLATKKHEEDSTRIYTE